jgi:hypothetical protein
MPEEQEVAALEKRIEKARLRKLVTTMRDDPIVMRRLNGWLTIWWILMIPISLVFGLLSSVAYVSALSLWALVCGHWSGWQAARVEVVQELEARIRVEDPIEEKVVERLLEETSLEPADGASNGLMACAPEVESHVDRAG